VFLYQESDSRSVAKGNRRAGDVEADEMVLGRGRTTLAFTGCSPELMEARAGCSLAKPCWWLDASTCLAFLLKSFRVQKDGRFTNVENCSQRWLS
jgi:hypothetical protein